MLSVMLYAERCVKVDRQTFGLAHAQPNFSASPGRCALPHCQRRQSARSPVTFVPQTPQPCAFCVGKQPFSSLANVEASSQAGQAR